MIRRFFRAMWNALKTPWVLALLCTCILILLVWILGPLVAIADRVLLGGVIARLVATVVLIFLWGLFVALWSSRQRRKALANPEKAAEYEQKAISKSQFREESDAIKDRLKAAIKIVTTSNFYGSKSRSRYALPWYLVLGTNNCGKTSMLLNSGLKFPINEQADRHLYNLKATERCEVLYSNEAVFVDTPGGYTNSRPDSPTHRLWTLLLRRLFRIRPARPLNGIVVCVSMRDIIDADQARREHLARTVRERLSEILKISRNYAPVYLLFTKCDAVPGFAPFFAHLSRAEREQFFGCPSEKDAMEPGEVRNEFRDLMSMLNAQIITKIHQERDVPSRGEMFRFPQELALLGGRLEDFIAEAFGPSRYHKQVMFRGFFFSSALSNRDLMAAVAREGELSFQKGFNAGTGDYARGFFLQDFLSKYVIPGAQMVSADREHLWRLRLRRYGMQIAAVVLFLVSGIVLGANFMNNYSRLETLGNVYTSFEAEQEKRPKVAESKSVLPELAKIQESLTVYNPGEDATMAYRLGLYQGVPFEKATQNAYWGVLNNRLMPTIRGTAAEKIESSLNNTTELKNALRAYLMLCQPKHMSEKFINDWLDKQWSERYMGQAETQATLRQHMDYLIAHGIVPVEPDAALVEKARQALLKIPLAELAYQRMQEEAEESGKPPFTFRSAIGDSPFSGDTYPVPVLYTRAGYEEYLIKRCPDIIWDLTKENWVFGPNPVALSLMDMNKVHKDVRLLYFRDYSKHWNQALQELAIRAPSTMGDAQKLAEQMTTGTSPSVLVLREIRTNTNFVLEREARGEGEVGSAVQDEISRRVQRRISRTTGTKVAKALVGQAGKKIEDVRNQAQEEAQREATAVQQYFMPLDSLLDTSGHANPALKAVNDNTVTVGEYFSRLINSDSKERRVLAALLEIADEKDDTLRRLENAIEKLPNPVRSWYATIVSGGLREMLSVGAHSINRSYQERVITTYAKNMRAYYPFNVNADRDVNLDDFAEFFRAGGTLDNFYDSHLRHFVTRSGSPRSIMGRTLPISGQAVAQLQRANRVQDAFFLSGRELGINFLMEPYALDATLKKVTLIDSGKNLSYWHGPVQGAAFNWPASGGQASLELTDLNGITTKMDTRGDWAIFRLFQGGGIKRQDGNTCLMEIQRNGKWAQFLIQFRSKVNPFDPTVCSFSLPESLL